MAAGGRHPLAGVEDEQQPHGPRAIRRAPRRASAGVVGEPDGVGDGGEQQPVVGERGEIGPPHPVGEAVPAVREEALTVREGALVVPEGALVVPEAVPIVRKAARTVAEAVPAVEEATGFVRKATLTAREATPFGRRSPAVPAARARPFGGPQRQPALAHTARTGQCDQPVLFECPFQQDQFGPTAHEAGLLLGNVPHHGGQSDPVGQRGRHPWWETVRNDRE